MVQWRALLAAVTALALLPDGSRADVFGVTPLVADQAATSVNLGFGPPRNTDSQLSNPWGITFNGASPFWVADNNTGVSTLYNSQGVKNQNVIVTIPGPNGSGPNFVAAPTGVVANTSSGFLVPTATGGTAKANFIFATEDGTISGWNSGSTAFLKVDNSANPSAATGAVYKGLAFGTTGGNSFLYAANFRAGTVEQYNSTFAQTNQAGLGTTNFNDPNIPAGFAPFGIRTIGNNVYVTYAQQDPNKGNHDDTGKGGFIDVFDLNGVLVQRLVADPTGTHLNSPWGVALAPSNFGQFSNDLLVGNFGSGVIDAFDPNNGTFLGTLNMPGGAPLTIPGLWGLTFGNAGQNGSPNQLFFTAGPNDERSGLFGTIDPVPEPTSAALFLVAGAGLLVLRRRRARAA